LSMISAQTLSVCGAGSCSRAIDVAWFRPREGSRSGVHPLRSGGISFDSLAFRVRKTKIALVQ